jgi:hypothetical protein
LILTLIQTEPKCRANHRYLIRGLCWSRTSPEPPKEEVDVLHPRSQLSKKPCTLQQQLSLSFVPLRSPGAVSCCGLYMEDRHKGNVGIGEHVTDGAGPGPEWKREDDRGELYKDFARIEEVFLFRISSQCSIYIMPQRVPFLHRRPKTKTQHQDRKTK